MVPSSVSVYKLLWQSDFNKSSLSFSPNPIFAGMVALFPFTYNSKVADILYGVSLLLMQTLSGSLWPIKP